MGGGGGARERISCFSQASVSLTLTCISHFSMDNSSHFHISTPPPLPNLIQLALFTLSSLIILSSPTSPLPWFQFLSHSTTRAHELKASKVCPNYTPNITADSCSEIRHNHLDWHPQMRKLVVVHSLTAQLNMVLACPRLLLLQESTEILSKTIDSQRFCLESLLRSR